jgi:hypothetical protein
MNCEAHGKDFAWVELSPGKSKHCCPDCLAGVRAADKSARLDIPMIKYSQNFHRDREYTAYEKSMPGGRAKKPQW